MTARRGTFMMIDGIAGSGKSTIIKAMFEHLTIRGIPCWRQQDWTHDRLPTLEDTSDAHVLFTFEPTRQWVGAAIRFEMSQTTHPYDGKELAHAFALDRQLLYRRLILPALNAGKIIVQDRGVTTSLVYQPVMPHSLTMDQIAQLPGNQLAIEHAPNKLVLTSVPVDQVGVRIAARTDDSKGVFADLELMRTVQKRFREPWFQSLFTARGTHIHTLDTSGTLEETHARAIALIEELMAQAESLNA